MTDHFDDENNEENEKSFAEMLDDYSPGSEVEVGIGDKIRGKIVSIGRDSVFVDTGSKIDGVVDKAELLDKDGTLALQEGDILELYVVALSECRRHRDAFGECLSRRTILNLLCGW